MTNEMAWSCRGRLRRDSGKAKLEDGRVPLYFCRALPLSGQALWEGHFAFKSLLFLFIKRSGRKTCSKKKKPFKKKAKKKLHGGGRGGEEKKMLHCFSFLPKKANKGTVEWIVTDKNVSSNRSRSRWRHRGDLVHELKVSGAWVGCITPNRSLWLLETVSWAISSCLYMNKKCFHLDTDIPLLHYVY